MLSLPGSRSGSVRTWFRFAFSFHVLALLALPGNTPAQDQQTFTGTITDSACARNGHAAMRMGPTDAECTIACVKAHDALYVLDVGPDSYTLSDQRTPERFAAKRVRVVGRLDAKTKTIQVNSISAVEGGNP
jgi:hypothetical protein